MPKNEQKSPTLRQFHQQQISRLWSAYKAARDQLDSSVGNLQLADGELLATLPKCDSDGCSNSKQIRRNGQNMWVCEVAPGDWVACNK